MWLIIAAGFVLLAILLHGDNISDVYKKLKYYMKTSALKVLFVITPLMKLHLIILRGRHYSNNLLVGKALTSISKIYGIEWHLRNGEILAEDRGAVIVSNHQSAFDIIGACHSFEVAGKIAMVAKKSIQYTGPLGLAAYLSETVFIDRNNPKAAIEALKPTIQMIINNKVKVWFYPEGTRNNNKTENMLPFKKGAFITAVATQAPIIPVVYSPYTFEDNNKYVLDKGYVIMQCMEPIETVGLTAADVPALMERSRKVMMHAYDKLSIEVMADLPSADSDTNYIHPHN